MHNRPPTIRKARRIDGKTVILRNAKISDASFIFTARNAPTNRPFLSSTPNQKLIDQENYLREYESSSEHAYFIICSKDGTSRGTIRLYDPCDSQCTWGSWILHENNNPAITLESVLLLLHYAMELGFSSIRSEANKENHAIRNFQRSILKIPIDHEDETSFHCVMNKDTIEGLLKKYRRLLPASIEIDYMDAAGS